LNWIEKFVQFWDRLSRSAPVIGIGVSFWLRPARLQREEDEDVAHFRVLLRKLEGGISISNYSVFRERVVISGELLGHIAAVSVGAALFFICLPFRYVFLATWILAFAADWFGGIVAGRLFDRKNADCQPDYNKYN